MFQNTKITVVAINGNHDYYPPNDQDMSTGAGNNTFINEYARIWKEAGWLSEQEAQTYS